jgi:hypothetical protein
LSACAASADLQKPHCNHCNQRSQLQLTDQPTNRPTNPPIYHPQNQLLKQIEKHWTEKPIEKMTERDWRIFREDFSITYR